MTCSSSLLRFVVDSTSHVCFSLHTPARPSCTCSPRGHTTIQPGWLREQALSRPHEAHALASRGSLARPYMLLLMSLSRFTCPSRGPWPPSAASVLQAPQPCLVGSLWQTTSTRARGSVQ